MVNKKAVKKTVQKKKPAVKKKAATVQKKTTIKKATTAKAKKPVAKKVTKKTVAKKPAVKSKPKVSSAKKATTTKRKAAATKVKKPAARKPAKKSLKNVIADVNIDVKTQKGSKTQNEKVVNVINNLSLKQEKKYVTTYPGVQKKVQAVQEISAPAHGRAPIAGILNYFKRIF
jgi:DnaK suppressor protein